MNLHSVKSRFLGSYVFLIVLFVVQLPIIYLLVGGMSKKFTQVDEAANLKKRAVELSYVLNRHILNGEEELEQVFQRMKGEYGEIIEGLRNGTANYPAIEDPKVLASLDETSKKWAGMKEALDQAMASGDSLTEVMMEVESSTYPMVDILNDVVGGFVALNDSSYGKSINLAGLQRMRTVNISYLMERYARSNFDLDFVLSNLQKTVKDFDETMTGLKVGSVSLGLKAVENPALLAQLDKASAFWADRKGLIEVGIRDKDLFAAKLTELADVHTPAIVEATNALTTALADEARSAAMTGVLIMALTIAFSVALAVFFIWSTNGHIIRPLIRLKQAVEAFTEGDLTRRAALNIRFFGRELDDEITSLGASVDEMADQMSGVIGRITDSSNLLASASEQLSASSAQIEAGAKKQSSQTTQAATAMEEMSATVIEVAKNSQQVSENARGAQDVATKGGDVVKQAIAAMQEVSESTSITADTIRELGRSSEEIGTIVSVINDIADQTNLLALNAAIEAARAGEQGRGFAVVADEVRKLAERTTNATKEISEMIRSIQEETTKAVDAMGEGTQKVENGVRLAHEAGESLGTIVMGVQCVTDMISHIATSTEEQSATADEISRNMDSIADVAKTNVNAIGEASNATEEITRLATELKNLVLRFRVESRGSGGATVTRLSERTASGESDVRRLLKAG